MFQRIKRWLYPAIHYLPSRSMEDLKGITKILFIDDRKFSVVNILKAAGWKNTQQIKDLESLDATEIQEANIVFVDISGVGRKLGFADEGQGLIVALKKKYPSKRYVIYSAERTGDRFHEGLSVSDARLPKNADPYEFQNLVENFAKESFNVDECVLRLQKILRADFSINLDEQTIKRNIAILAKGGDLSVDKVAKIFNLTLSHAGSIASIISLLVSK